MSRDLVQFLFTTLFSLFAFAAVFLSAHMFLARRRQQEEQRLALHTRLLDRVGSAKEFGEFLATDAGRQFLGAIAPDATHPQLRMLRAVRAGIVLAIVGAGLLIGQVNNMFWGVNMGIVAVLALTGGTGMLIAAAVSYRLARKLGIVEDDAAHARYVTPAR